jgi:hypothetical protein
MRHKTPLIKTSVYFGCSGLLWLRRNGIDGIAKRAIALSADGEAGYIFDVSCYRSKHQATAKIFSFDFLFHF